MPTFEETMENSRIFLTYSLAMTMLGKSAQILAERGADPKAMSFVTTGIELLAKQLRDYADSKDLEEGAEQELEKLCKMLDIKRAD
ncbi:hypothetical protein EHM69_05420 [candidate division KSB1 bacterium]|nr:MAG: hypothetical protein EHM69_05420 [candidate division KSB1 bacterium]